MELLVAPATRSGRSIRTRTAKSAGGAAATLSRLDLGIVRRARIYNEVTNITDTTNKAELIFNLLHMHERSVLLSLLFWPFVLVVVLLVVLVLVVLVLRLAYFRAVELLHFQRADPEGGVDGVREEQLPDSEEQGL